MRKLHCSRVEFSRLTRVFRTESDWNTAKRAHFPVSAELVVRVFGRTSVARQSELRTNVR